LLSLKLKEAKLQSKSLLPHGGGLRLTYEHIVLIIARRLIKSGRDPNQQVREAGGLSKNMVLLSRL
jgi:hypothetical protein